MEGRRLQSRVFLFLGDILFNTHMEKQEITLVRATEADASEYVRIEKSVECSINLVTTDLEEAKKEIAESVAYIVHVNGGVVGLVSYKLRSAEQAYLAEIAIHPEYQGRGIGGVVLERILSELKEKGVVRVELATHPDNPARRLYERHGFVVHDQVENYEGSGTPRLLLRRSFAKYG